VLRAADFHRHWRSITDPARPRFVGVRDYRCGESLRGPMLLLSADSAIGEVNPRSNQGSTRPNCKVELHELARNLSLLRQ
jgi:hypothetical protein